eukprot:XP_014782744.1 PREDICTED: uncharacterized protein LOC106878137 [Octopus bimaculoides]
MVDMLWSVLKRGKMLGHIEEEIREFEDPASYWSLLNEVMSEGELFVEIGGCRTAYRVAMDWRNRHSSIIALLFRVDSMEWCVSKSKKYGLEGFFIASIIDSVQQIVQSLYLDNQRSANQIGTSKRSSINHYTIST